MSGVVKVGDIVGNEHGMMLKCGLVNGIGINWLRDMGCTGVVVKVSLVREEQVTSECNTLRMIDGSVICVRMAVLNISTSIHKGLTEAMMVENPPYDLIVSNRVGVGKSPVVKTHDGMILTRLGSKDSSKGIDQLKVSSFGGNIDSGEFKKTRI